MRMHIFYTIFASYVVCIANKCVWRKCVNDTSLQQNPEENSCISAHGIANQNDFACAGFGELVFQEGGRFLNIALYPGKP